MTKVLLPFFPEGTKMINSSVGTKKINDTIVYFNEAGPFYKHDKDDYKSFRFVTSQMMDLHQVKQVEVINFFKISKESAKRWLKVYREKGASDFFKAPKTRKGGTILTPEIIGQIELMLNGNMSIKEIGSELGIKTDTIKKGVQSGRIQRPPEKIVQEENKSEEAKTQSMRSNEDASSPMGMGCTNIEGRVEALKKK